MKAVQGIYSHDYFFSFIDELVLDDVTMIESVVLSTENTKIVLEVIGELLASCFIDRAWFSLNHFGKDMKSLIDDCMKGFRLFYFYWLWDLFIELEAFKGFKHRVINEAELVGQIVECIHLFFQDWKLLTIFSFEHSSIPLAYIFEINVNHRDNNYTASIDKLSKTINKLHLINFAI